MKKKVELLVGLLLFLHSGNKKVELHLGLLLLLQFRKEEGRASSWLVVVVAIQERRR
jgi:hypothetical protein